VGVAREVLAESECFHPMLKAAVEGEGAWAKAKAKVVGAGEVKQQLK
jgi:hypothetical protein